MVSALLGFELIISWVQVDIVIVQVPELKFRLSKCGAASFLLALAISVIFNDDGSRKLVVTQSP